MLRSTFYSFTTALRGLNTSQRQLDITGQNISNVGTIGYTRQRADVYSSAPGGLGDRYGHSPSTLVGQGSVIGRISQCRDQFLDVRFRREAANLGENGAKLEGMEDLSLVFDEIEKSGLMGSFNDFVSKLQALAGNVESSEFDSIARDSAETLMKQFNQYAKQLAGAREESEYNLSEVTAKSVNDLLGNIANLNKSIREVQCNGGPALELKDERNMLLDELSNYVKLDVKYSPKEIAGGIIVEDVSVNIVGADGTSQPLIFNETAATLNVKTPGKDGTDRAIVTIDSSALPAKKAITDINNFLKSIAGGNTTLQSINKELEKLYPGDPTATPPTLPLKWGDLPGRLTQISDSIIGPGGFDEQLATKQAAMDAARQAIKDRIADTTNPPTQAELDALSQAYAATVVDHAGVVTQKSAALKEQKTLTNYNKTATEASNRINSGETALNNALGAFGVLAVPKQTTPGDYSTTVYNFERVGTPGVPILDAGGNPISWDAGKTHTELDRAALSELGITFTAGFDAEAFGSPGSLKGSIDMLNSEGVFDYNTSPTRGFGFYKNMLDGLADKLATTLNVLNDKLDTPQKEFLFQTSDGSSKFTASNIRIAEGWENGKYSITGTKKPLTGGDNSAKNDNLLLMISTISKKMTYSTGPITQQDQQGNYLKTAADGTTSIVANGRDSAGNYTMDGVLVCNKDMINYKPDGTLDAKMISPATSTRFQDPDGNIVANGRDADGKYTMTTTAPDGTVTTVLVANADGLMYKTEPDGSLSRDEDGNLLLSLNRVSPETPFQDPSGNIVANGRDAYGNYTMTAIGADGKKVSTIVANADGVMYKTEPDGSLSKDADGNPILDGTRTALDHKSERFLHNGTFQEFLSNISNVLSLDISSTSNLVENHQTVLDSIQSSKDSISSVSLDEEGVNIMQYQKAYNASARLMTALDESIERIINQMGTVGR